MIDYFKIASNICRKDAERLRRERDGRIASLTYIPLIRAAVCVDCEVLFAYAPSCPNCGGESIMPLERPAKQGEHHE